MGGTGAFIGMFAPLFQWPSIPTPVSPLGNPDVPALVVGNLYDPSTSYTWSQQMHQVFPAGAMMTWQGVGHSLTIDKYDLKDSVQCFRHILQYLRTGVLPKDGYVCRQRNSVPVLLEQPILPIL